MQTMDMFGSNEVILSVNDRKTSSSSSKGNQTKWYKNGFWYKSDYFGYECLAEVLSSQLLTHSNVKSFVSYELCWARECDDKFPVCRSRSFVSGNQEFKTFYRIFEEMGFQVNKELAGLCTASRILKVCGVIFEYCGLNVLNYVYNCLLFDACVLGEDRHFNNLGIIKEDNTFKLAPIFDNGLSLLSDEFNYKGPNLSKLIASVKCKPFSSEFKKQVHSILELGGSPIKLNPSKISWDNFAEYYTAEKISRAHSVFDLVLEHWEGSAWTQ